MSDFPPIAMMPLLLGTPLGLLVLLHRSVPRGRLLALARYCTGLFILGLLNANERGIEINALSLIGAIVLLVAALGTMLGPADQE